MAYKWSYTVTILMVTGLFGDEHCELDQELPMYLAKLYRPLSAGWSSQMMFFSKGNPSKFPKNSGLGIMTKTWKTYHYHSLPFRFGLLLIIWYVHWTDLSQNNRLETQWSNWSSSVRSDVPGRNIQDVETQLGDGRLFFFGGGTPQGVPLPVVYK